jgi:uncharacterized damage-inducible protein DinB
MMINTIKNTISVFEYYKSLGEKAMAQVSDEALFHMPDEKSNSIAVIVNHLHGNMLSRWTDFLTSDGEKAWRKRDEEFKEATSTRAEVMHQWNEGWACLLDTLNALTPDDLSKTVYVRNMGQSAEDAIIRQLAHYAYHTGQIVYLARLFNEGNWTSLTISKGESATYNAERFQKEKEIKHFTQDK